MNYNPYQNKRSDMIDPNYIYPQPYIDPIMYMNPYAMSNDPSINYNSVNQAEYSTYSNPYAENPQLYTKNDINDSNSTYYSNNNNDETNNNVNNSQGIPIMPPNSGFPNMMPYINTMPNMMMPSNMIFPNMMPYMNMMPNMMVPSNMMFPNMMPYMNMMPNIPAVNMEEFDEEEM